MIAPLTQYGFHSEGRALWVQATRAGRDAFGEYLANLELALSWRPPGLGATG